MEAVFFEHQSAFREWLEANHETETELLVGFYKVATGRASMTWPQSVDQALCFGWIDGVRRSIDEESYCIRFTPRKPSSIWSTVNIKKVEALTKAGLMKPAGQKAYGLRTAHKSEVYAYEQDEVKLDEKYEAMFRGNQEAWDFFMKQAPSYRKRMLHWVMSGKQEKTRMDRLEKIILESSRRKRL